MRKINTVVNHRVWGQFHGTPAETMTITMFSILALKILPSLGCSVYRADRSSHWHFTESIVGDAEGGADCVFTQGPAVG